MTFQGLGDPWAGGRLRFFSQNMAHVPIPQPNSTDKEALASLSQQASKATGENLKGIELQIDQIVYRLFQLTDEEIAVIEAALNP